MIIYDALKLESRWLGKQKILLTSNSYLHICVVGSLNSDITNSWENVIGVEDAGQVLWRDGDGELENAPFQLGNFILDSKKSSQCTFLSMNCLCEQFNYRNTLIISWAAVKFSQPIQTSPELSWAARVIFYKKHSKIKIPRTNILGLYHLSCREQLSSIKATTALHNPLNLRQGF